ncbi:hypothetical protein NKI72_30070 [Mesorhizobium sp. M0437]|uniref:hypothetical protein n=1 Tax=Mesorhizobium sp. M0437 TaxID=2956945 RepID=UPI003336F33F
MKKTIINLMGQAVWAASQAICILVLSHHSMASTIGVYTLGLSIFAPLCLLFGLNLRVVMSFESVDSSVVNDALILRVAGVLFSYTVTALVISFLTDLASSEKWVALALIAGRVGDQVSDLIIGIYQRENSQARIAISFAGRGIAGMVPFLGVIYLGGSFLEAAILSSTCVIATAVLLDVCMSMQFGPAGHVLERTSFKRIRRLVLDNLWVGMFPALDSLHTNCFRFGIFLTSSAQIMGFVGAAQTLFVPFQMLATAVGFIFLPEAIRVHRSGNKAAYTINIFKGISVGLAIGLAFFMVSVLIGDRALTLVFGNASVEMRTGLYLTAVAMILIHASGFVGLSVVARGATRVYTSAPIVGIIVFVLLLAPEFFFDFGSASIGMAVAISFAGSILARLLYSLVYVFRQ